MVTAMRAASAAISVGGWRDNSSAPPSAPGPLNPVSKIPSRAATTCTPSRMRGRSSSTHSPSEFAISARCTLSA
jgi:hypothetical protein